jgi:hypothetical protein
MTLMVRQPSFQLMGSLVAKKKGLIPMGLGLQGPVRALPVVQVLRRLGQPKVYLQHVSSSHKVRIFFF